MNPKRQAWRHAYGVWRQKMGLGKTVEEIAQLDTAWREAVHSWVSDLHWRAANAALARAYPGNLVLYTRDPAHGREILEQERKLPWRVVAKVDNGGEWCCYFWSYDTLLSENRGVQREMKLRELRATRAAA